jgi:hypothetical protein
MVRPSRCDQLQHLDLAGTQAAGTVRLGGAQERFDSMNVGVGTEPEADCPRRLELQLGSVVIS